MSKLEDAQAKARKILEDMQNQSAQTESSSTKTTEVNVETHSSQTTTSGTVNTDDSDAGAQTDRVAELTADLQRVQAEFSNYKRRTEGEKAEVAGYITARTVREFLATRDSFDQELAHRPKDLDPKWAASIDAIRAQFDKTLSNLNVERFVSIGQPFDPHLHEAISMDGGDEVVIEELQAGYKMGDTILRHAMVKVGPAPAKKQ